MWPGGQLKTNHSGTRSQYTEACKVAAGLGNASAASLQAVVGVVISNLRTIIDTVARLPELRPLIVGAVPCLVPLLTLKCHYTQIFKEFDSLAVRLPRYFLPIAIRQQPSCKVS